MHDELPAGTAAQGLHQLDVHTLRATCARLQDTLHRCVPRKCSHHLQASINQPIGRRTQGDNKSEPGSLKHGLSRKPCDSVAELLLVMDSFRCEWDLLATFAEKSTGAPLQKRADIQVEIQAATVYFLTLLSK